MNGMLWTGWGGQGPGAGTQVLTGSVELGLCPGEHGTRVSHMLGHGCQAQGRVEASRGAPRLLYWGSPSQRSLQGARWCLPFTGEESEASEPPVPGPPASEGAELGLDPASLPPRPRCPSLTLPAAEAPPSPGYGSPGCPPGLSPGSTAALIDSPGGVSRWLNFFSASVV